MFFTAEATYPFESRKDVINAYPEWKLKIRSGNEHRFQQNAENGNEPAYKVFWKRSTENPEESKFNSIGQGINDIIEDQIVIHIQHNSLRKYYTQFPTTNVPTIIDSEGESNDAEYMIVTENSPLGPILDKELKKILEAGIFDIARMTWIGKDLPKDERIKNPDALGQGQVMMVFIVLFIAVVASIIVLAVERIYFQFEGNAFTRYKSNER